jgi:1,2-phenylacetyl-CoA epoxidase catalytic subunit
MTGGFALVAWPAQYNVTGVMTFLVDRSGVVREKDLGSTTDATARHMTAYNPDQSWRPAP